MMNAVTDRDEALPFGARQEPTANSKQHIALCPKRPRASPLRVLYAPGLIDISSQVFDDEKVFFLPINPLYSAFAQPNCLTTGLLRTSAQ